MEHMDSNQQLRALFSTLVIIRNHISFTSLCQSKIAIDLIRVVVQICGEAVEKAEQLNSFFRDKQANSIEAVSVDNNIDHNKPNFKKVFLVPRCICNHYNDDSPEDLILLLDQISTIWCKMASLVSSSLLSSSPELAVIFDYCMRLLNLDYNCKESSCISDVEISIRQACGKWYLYPLILNSLY
jgi:hypothetical protein